MFHDVAAMRCDLSTDLKAMNDIRRTQIVEMASNDPGHEVSDFEPVSERFCAC